jgi:hypothetical protein
MSGGPRYWNEQTQRWEGGDPGRPPWAPVTPPPPARPAHAPTWPPVGDGGPSEGPADGDGAVGDTPADEASPAGPASSGSSSSSSSSSGAAVSPPSSSTTSVGSTAPIGSATSGGWPGAGEGSAWHGPAVAGTGARNAGSDVPGAEPEPPDEWPTGAFGGSPLPGDRPAGPGPARGVNRRLVWSVLVGAAAVAVAVSLVLTFVIGAKDQKPSADTSTAPTTPASQHSDDTATSPTPSPTMAASPSAPELPDGYELYEDDEGFRIALPTGWSRSTVASQFGIAVVNYRSPDREHRLQVYQVAEDSPAASFKLYLSDATAKGHGFRELGLQNLDDGDFTGSRLEYLTDSIKGEPDVGTWHVYDERFVAADGNIYAIAAYGPDADGRDDELSLLTTAVEGFCPSNSCAPAS